MAKAGTDLNLSAGPGVQNEVVGVNPGGADVSVAGRIDAANWCQVTHGGATGWAYGDYLAAQMGEAFQPIYPNRQGLNVAVIQYDEPEPRAARQVAGALIAGRQARWWVPLWAARHRSSPSPRPRSAPMSRPTRSCRWCWKARS